MFPSYLYCGIPLQRAVQCLATADIILGIIYYYLVAVGNYKFESSHNAAFIPLLNQQPFPMWLTAVTCYTIQHVMGIVLLATATALRKHHRTLMFWMIMTAFTAIFTGLIWRLYEMGVVYEYYREQTLDEDPPDYEEIQSGAQACPVRDPEGLTPAPLAEPCPNISIISRSELGQGRAAMGYTYYRGLGTTSSSNGQYGNRGNRNTGFQNSIAANQVQLQFQFEDLEQPPPEYEEVMKQQNDCNDGHGNRLTSSQVSTEFPRVDELPALLLLSSDLEGNEFLNSFSQF